MDGPFVPLTIFMSLVTSGVYFVGYRRQKHRVEAIEGAARIDTADGMKALPKNVDYIAVNGYTTATEVMSNLAGGSEKVTGNNAPFSKGALYVERTTIQENAHIQLLSMTSKFFRHTISKKMSLTTNFVPFNISPTPPTENLPGRLLSLSSLKDANNDASVVHVPSFEGADPFYLSQSFSKLREWISPRTFTFDEIMSLLKNLKMIPKETRFQERCIPGGQYATVLGYARNNADGRGIVLQQSQGRPGPFIFSKLSYAQILAREREALQTRKFWSNVCTIISASLWGLYVFRLVQKKRFLQREIERVRALREEGARRKALRRSAEEGKANSRRGQPPFAGEGKADRSSQPGGEEKEDVDDCIICYDEPVCIAFVSCGHMNTCKTCADKLEICPICKHPIEQRLYVYP